MARDASVDLTVVTMALRQQVAAPVNVVWELLTDPQRMNTWSTARIELADPGDRQRPDGVGALRRVYLPHGGGRLTEVVHAAEPPHFFGYTVVGGAAALREHTGRIVVLPAGDDEAQIRWDVAVQFAVPGLDVLTQCLIEGELRRSLRRLAELAPTAAPAGPLPPPRRVEQRDLPALHDVAEAVLAEQRSIADRLTRADDPKQWFARVYQYVTEEQLASLYSGRVDNPEWVLRLIPRFHELYLRNLISFERGEPTEEPWRKAWGLAERAGATGSASQLGKALLLGVAAHIEADLPRALHATYREHFRDRCDYVYFRADYLRMADIFRVASDRLMGDMPRRHVPVWLQAARTVLPPELRDQLMRSYYDTPRRRMAAFDAGRDLLGSDPQPIGSR